MTTTAGRQWAMRRWLPAGLILVCLASSTAQAEPEISLKLPRFPSNSFPNGSSVVFPASPSGDIEVWLQDALAELQVSTVRVRLNETPMAAFLTINRMPRGLRVILKMGASINPDFSLRSDRTNTITFSAQDASNVGYEAQFFVTLDPAITQPKLADRAPMRPPIRQVIAPAQISPPRVRLTANWPARSADRVLTLEAEIADPEGLRRIVVEVNSKAVDEVILENELPVRKRSGFIAKGQLPGSVTGDGRKIFIAIPVTFDKRLNTVAVKAESRSGLTDYATHTIEITTIR